MIQYPIYNLGPGKRIGIWVQGCDLGCSGCVNKTTWNKRGGKSVAVLDVFNWIAGIAGDFDGITISGGEPFQQYEALISFLYLIKNRTDFDSYCFSGYTLDELDKLFPDKLFYRFMDFLVDGRYVRDLHEDKNTKGSSNQSLYHFVDGVAVEQKSEFRSHRFSAAVDQNLRVHLAGIPKQDDLKYLVKNLAEAGVTKEFK